MIENNNEVSKELEKALLLLQQKESCEGTSEREPTAEQATEQTETERGRNLM